MERITSRRNPLLQRIRKLQNVRSFRYEQGMYVGDGVKLLEEAVRWGADLRTVVATEGLALPPLPQEARQVTVPPDVMKSISQMQTPQGVLFVCAMAEAAPPPAMAGCVILDGIQDPGNLGTMLRTADALDISLVLTEGCVDPYGPKVVRASMGAVFRVPPRSVTRREAARLCREQGVALIAAALSEDAADIRALDLSRAAVVIGSEGQGVSRELLELSAGRVVIPMNPRCESLNAAAAAAIIMWQMKR
ncbi:MAG: RNA methyltransferase [Oscillospiraceae bacterium]|nr:RNA methyltransferase [Oscillospiraceae bacterium]